MTRRLQPGDRVTLHYRIASYGQQIANTFPDAPERFVLGSGEIDPRLEQHLLGLAAGERRIFELQAWQAFGERDDALVQTLPRAEFPAGQALTPGHQVEFALPNGESWLGAIVEADADSVRVDFNHPLAGLPVEFEAHIIEIE